MKKIIFVIAVIFLTSFSLTSCKKEAKDEKKEQVEVVSADEDLKIAYQCPMKCEEEKTYEKEGKCPVCKMNLKKKEKDTEEEHEEHEHDEEHDN
jgi:uncharacterized protein YxeA